MLNPDLIDDGVLEDIMQNCDDVSHLSVEEALDKFLIYNGIYGYTEMIMEAVTSLLAAEVPEMIVDNSQTADIMDDLLEGEVLVITRLPSRQFFLRKLDS